MGIKASTMINVTVLLQYAEYELKTLALTEDAGTFIAWWRPECFDCDNAYQCGATPHSASTGGLWSAVQSLQSCGEDNTSCYQASTDRIKRLGSCNTFYDEPWTMDLTLLTHLDIVIYICRVFKMPGFNVANKTHLVWQIPWDNSPGPGLVTSEQI